jgi:hypothetical protein
MTEAKIIELPGPTLAVDGVGEPVNFESDESVNTLLKFYAKDPTDPIDPAYLGYRKVLEAYRGPIAEASKAVVSGSESFDLAARRVVEIFFHELMVTPEVDRKANKVWVGDTMKRVRALILDGAGLVEMDDEKKSGSARNSARDAINRRCYNRIDAVKALATHEMSYLVQTWKRPGGKGTADGGEPGRTTYNCNWSKPSEAIEKATEIVNEARARLTADDTSRSTAEMVLEKLAALSTAEDALVAQLQAIINLAKTATEQDEATEEAV